MAYLEAGLCSSGSKKATGQKRGLYQKPVPPPLNSSAAVSGINTVSAI